MIQSLTFMKIGKLPGSSMGSFESPLCDRLLYLTTCLIGHHVEVHVRCGSVYSGIFHATNSEDDFGTLHLHPFLLNV